MINITNKGTWEMYGDIVDGNKIVNGAFQEELGKIRELVNTEGVTKDDIAALISVLQEINASQNDLTTEYAYMASIERNAPKSGFLKKLQEKITLTNGVMTLSKSVGEILSKHPEAVGAVTGFLGTL